MLCSVRGGVVVVISSCSQKSGKNKEAAQCDPRFCCGCAEERTVLSYKETSVRFHEEGSCGVT